MTSKIRFRGATSGFVELAAPDAAGNNTLVLPTGNGTSGQYLQTNGSGALSWATVAGVSVAVIADQKTNGTDGGTFTSGDWRTRDLNTEISDPSSIVSIASNQFTLIAGTYLIEFAAPANGVSFHRTRLYDITNAAVIAQGINSFDYPDPSLEADLGTSRGAGVVSITSNTIYEIQHRCNISKNSNGFGRAASFSANEQYTTVTILKVA